MSSYIFKRLCTTIGAVITIFVVLLWLTQSLKFLEVIVNNNVSVQDYLSLIVFLLPDLFVKVAPICVLIGSIITYSKITIDNEIQVMQALGKSPWQIIKPGIIIAASLTILLLFLNIFTIPATFRAFRNQEFELRNQFSSSIVKEGGFGSLRGGVTIFVEKRISQREFSKVFIHSKGKASTHKSQDGYTIFAKNGFLKNIDGKYVLILENGVRQEKDKKNIIHSFQFEQIAYDLDEFTNVVNQRSLKPYERDLKELFNINNTNKTSNHKLKSRLAAEGHQRILTPFLCLANIILVAIIMVINYPSRRLRRKRMIGLILTGILFQWVVINLLQLHGRFKFFTPLAYTTVVGVIAFGMYALLSGCMHHKIQRFMNKCGI